MFFQKFLLFSKFFLKFWIVLLPSFLVCLTTKNYAATKNGYEATQWLASGIDPEIVGKVEKKIDSEILEPLLRRDSPSPVGLGFSFPGLNEIRQLCLKEVRQLYGNHGERPRVADLGAGLGNMTWKLLAAGGRVDAFEIQEFVVQKLKTQMGGLNLRFLENSPVEEILNVFSKDVLTIQEGDPFISQYDVIWLGQLLHLLNPDDFQKLTGILIKMLKPGGKIFWESDTIFAVMGVENHWMLQDAQKRAIEKSKDFPGFMAANMAAIVDSSNGFVQFASVISVLEQDQLEEQGYQMNASGSGYFSPESLDAAGFVLDQSFSVSMKSRSSLVRLERYHQLLNFIEKNAVERFFKNFGFTLLDSFYSDDRGHRFNESGSLVCMKLGRASDEIFCHSCKKRVQSMHRCSSCKKTYYCTFKCQKKDWCRHKKECHASSDFNGKSQTFSCG